MQDKSASQHPAIQRTGRPKRRRWLLLLVLFLIAAGAVVLVASIKGNAGAGTTSGGTFTARRDNLVITVSEGGSIRAHKSIEYRCEVESRGAQITILSIVPSGAYISQKDVEEGMVLVKLDSSSLEDQLIQEKRGLAVAGLRSSKCQGCQMTNSGTTIRAAAEGKIVRCDSCGRILCPL